MRFAKYTFLIAGIYGLLALLPMYFTEAQYGVDNPPAITHPEFYYGFIGVAVAFQIVFIIISRDPFKYRTLILPSIIEKFSFVIAVAILVYAGRTSGLIVIGAGIDALLGTLFSISWFKLSGADRS
jgi:hypothetical protein